LYSNLTSSCLFSPNSILKKCSTVEKRPPKALPPCFLAWVKSLPENEKETLRKLRAETVRRHKEGLIPVDNNGKSIDEVFGSETEERKMQSVENWIKFVKRPLPKCFQAYIENLPISNMP
jgi:hypothetical protein